MTQEELAERINLQQAYIGGVERGEKKYFHAYSTKIADADGLEDLVLNFGNINLIDNPQRGNLLVLLLLYFIKNADELQFILKFLQDFSEFVENNSIK